MLPKLMADITAIHKTDPSLIVAFNITAQDIARRDFIDSLLLSI